MRKLFALVILLTAGSAIATVKVPAISAGWNCSNVDLEVSCNATECKVSKGHTPMDVHVNASEISVCAYSGCWVGAPSTVTQSGPFQTFTGLSLPFSTNPDSLANVSVTINGVSRVAMILVGGEFTNPALCTAQ